MPFHSRTICVAATLAALSLAPSGCISNILADGQIAATRKASVSVNTIADYELQRSATEAGIAQFEGMHYLRPGNEDGLFLLLQSWGGYAYAFPQDAYEEALDKGDEELASYHKKRARLAYDRAIFFGLELLGHRADGFEGARRNNDTLAEWLSHFTSQDDAVNLFWTGYAWISRVDLYKDDTAMVAELFIGVAMMERSVALDPTVEHFTGTLILAGYHSRPAGELERGKELFDLALGRSERKNLQIQLNYATTYACLKGDRTLYESLLTEVLGATDPDPEQRLTNLLAKRRARRALGKARMQDCGFDMSARRPSAPAPPSTAPAGTNGAPKPAGGAAPKPAAPAATTSPKPSIAAAPPAATPPKPNAAPATSASPKPAAPPAPAATPAPSAAQATPAVGSASTAAAPAPAPAPNPKP